MTTLNGNVYASVTWRRHLHADGRDGLTSSRSGRRRGVGNDMAANTAVLQAEAVPNGASGFMSGADKAKLDSVSLLHGNVTLVAGTATVSNSEIKSTSVILLTPKTAGGTIGTLTYTIVNNTSFTITSSSGTDTSTISYVVF